MRYRYFLKNRIYRYVDVLQDLVTSYNQRPHRGKRAHATVTKKNADEVYSFPISVRRRNRILF